MSIEDLLPDRPIDMHKGIRGRLLIAGGSERYVGAPALSALGALRSGAGVVTLLSLQKVCDACASRLPEIVYCPEDDRTKWRDEILSRKDIHAIVIGPGLDRMTEACEFVCSVWDEWPEKILVDGDGLYALSISNVKSRSNAVITPHEGEAARLLGVTPNDIRSDRLGAVRELAMRYGCAVLKGHNTLIASGDRFAQVNHGGSELSVPGSGDVLSGCIGAFLAMGLDVFDAAVLGANIHGLAGEFLAIDGVDGVLASEIADMLRRVIHELREGTIKI